MPALTVVFVHGWSVTDLETYAGLPERLVAEGGQYGYSIDVKNVFLGRYISFRDEVKLKDVSRAFDTALADELAGVTSFVCITHSTGGPVIRDWYDRYWKQRTDKCPLSHLIMLAPANFGSALAQLGKGTLSRLKSWFGGVEPGQGVLDWLELGSREACDLNIDWIRNGASQISTRGFYPFVIVGQSIDRKLYDALNSYTGETGSDGVVRTAAANLEASYIRIEQPLPTRDANGKLRCADFTIQLNAEGPAVPLRIVAGKSHSGAEMGIMNSVQKDPTDTASAETVAAIFDCVKVKSKADYGALYDKFKQETDAVQMQETLEIEKHFLLSDRVFIHDIYSMLIFRVFDSEGYPVEDFDLYLTAGPENDPNHLPEGFFVDRQRNRRSKNTVTYFLNHTIMNGADKLMNGSKKVRDAIEGITQLGITVVARPDNGFVRYLPCGYAATQQLFNKAIRPNSTTIIDICLQRLVDKEVMRLEHLQTYIDNGRKADFSDTKPGMDIVA